MDKKHSTVFKSRTTRERLGGEKQENRLKTSGGSFSHR